MEYSVVALAQPDFLKKKISNTHGLFSRKGSAAS